MTHVTHLMFVTHLTHDPWPMTHRPIPCSAVRCIWQRRIISSTSERSDRTVYLRSVSPHCQFCNYRTGTHFIATKSWQTDKTCYIVQQMQLKSPPCTLDQSRAVEFRVTTRPSTKTSRGHGRRPVNGQGTFAPTFWSRGGRPVFCPPTFSAVDIFLLMHTVFIRWLEQFR